MTGAWPVTPPYQDAAKDRWLRLTWAAQHYKIDRATLVAWVMTGVVAAKQSGTSGRWVVSDRALRTHLFGSPDARS